MLVFEFLEKYLNNLSITNPIDTAIIIIEKILVTPSRSILRKSSIKPLANANRNVYKKNLRHPFPFIVLKSKNKPI